MPRITSAITSVFCLGCASVTAAELAISPQAFYGIGIGWFLSLTVVADMTLAFGGFGSHARWKWMGAFAVVASALPVSLFCILQIWPKWRNPIAVVPVYVPYIQLTRSVFVLVSVATIAALSSDHLIQTFFPENGRRNCKFRATAILVSGLLMNPFVLGFRPQLSPPSLYPDAGIYGCPVFLKVTRQDRSHFKCVNTTNGEDPLNLAANCDASQTLTLSDSSVVRCAAIGFGRLPSKVVTHTYVISPSIGSQNTSLITNRKLPSDWNGTHANYTVDLAAANGDQENSDFVQSRQLSNTHSALLSLPVLCITIQPLDIFGSSGIYSNPIGRGEKWERKCHIEGFHRGSQFLATTAQLRIHGNASRSPKNTSKHSFRVYLRDKRRLSARKWPFFSRDSSEIDLIVLRAGGIDSWRFGRLRDVQYVRDEFARRLHHAMGGQSPEGGFTHVFVNGLYWGVYNAVEQTNDSFAVRRSGGDKDDWDIIKDGEVKDGNADAWTEILQLCEKISTHNDSRQVKRWYYQLTGRTPSGEKDHDANKLLDVENYIDYILLNLFVQSCDWPGTNYVAYGSRRLKDQGFRFAVWDCEQSLGINLTESVNCVYSLNAGRGVAKPFVGLAKCELFRDSLRRRIHLHFGRDGILGVNSRVASNIYNSVSDEIEDSIYLEAIRWGNQGSGKPVDCVGNWKSTREWITTSYLMNRPKKVLRELYDAEYLTSEEYAELIQVTIE